MSVLQAQSAQLEELKNQWTTYKERDDQKHLLINVWQTNLGRVICTKSIAESVYAHQ
jgi:hypothetical protein